jgi:hypothetical protein
MWLDAVSAKNLSPASRLSVPKDGGYIVYAYRSVHVRGALKSLRTMGVRNHWEIEN